MFGFCCKRLQLLLASSSISVDSVTHLHRFPKASHFSRSYSSKSLLGSKIDKPKEKDGSFTVQYLVSSCGLSPEVALSLSKKRRVHFKSREKPDSVIKLLKDYGFNDTHIAQLIKKRPVVLLTNPEKTLLPKLEFLSSIGLSGSAIPVLICCNPYILERNLDTGPRPCYDIIRSLLLPDVKLALFFRYCQRLSLKGLRNIVCNVSVLRELKVQESTVSAFVACQPSIMSLENEKFHENVMKVLSMGINPLTATTFMKALHVVSLYDSSKWAHKLEFYRKYCWTEDDFFQAFRKTPVFMLLAEKNISSKMEFIVNKMALVQPAYLAHNPKILTYSLENRIIPRGSVIRVLMLKGLITRGDFSFSNLISCNNKNFLLKCVVPYQPRVPELLSIFEGKMSPVELGTRI